jgi:hypothetical protein
LCGIVTGHERISVVTARPVSLRVTQATCLARRRGKCLIDNKSPETAARTLGRRRPGPERRI